MSSEIEPPPFVRYDDVWPTCEGATPILEVAIRQRLINIDLALLHLQLVQSLLLIASLEIKGIHALSLFDQRVVRNMFCSFIHLTIALFIVVRYYVSGKICILPGFAVLPSSSFPRCRSYSQL